jgi:hypothetical protein
MGWTLGGCSRRAERPLIWPLASLRRTAWALAKTPRTPNTSGSGVDLARRAGRRAQRLCGISPARRSRRVHRPGIGAASSAARPRVPDDPVAMPLALARVDRISNSTGRNGRNRSIGRSPSIPSRLSSVRNSPHIFTQRIQPFRRSPMGGWSSGASAGSGKGGILLDGADGGP